MSGRANLFLRPSSASSTRRQTSTASLVRSTGMNAEVTITTINSRRNAGLEIDRVFLIALQALAHEADGTGCPYNEQYKALSNMSFDAAVPLSIYPRVPPHHFLRFALAPIRPMHGMTCMSSVPGHIILFRPVSKHM